MRKLENRILKIKREKKERNKKDNKNKEIYKING